LKNRAPAIAMVGLCLLGCTPSRLTAPLRFDVEGIPDEAFRATPPPHPVLAEAFDTPPRTWTLPNGLHVLLFERHAYPVFDARLLVKRGALDLGDFGARQSAQVAYLYARGGSEAVFERLAVDTAQTGTMRTSGIERSLSWANVGAPAAELDPALDILARSSFDVHLTQEEYARRAPEWVQAAKAGLEPFLAAQRLLLFGSRHPYGYAGPGRTVIPLREAQDLYERVFQPADATLVVVGDVAPEALEASVERTLGRGSASALATRLSEPHHPSQIARVSILPRPNLTQIRASVFARGPIPSSDDFLAFSLAASLLGGAQSSLLRERLREGMGAAYSVGAFTQVERTASWMTLYAAYDADKAVDGVGAILAAVRNLRAGKVDDADLAAARESLAARWRAAMSTVAGAASAYCFWIALGKEPDWAIDLPARVARIGKEDLVRIANRYLTDMSMHVLFVGDGRWLYPGPLGMGGMATLDLPE
jgi:zinc protease